MFHLLTVTLEGAVEFVVCRAIRRELGVSALEDFQGLMGARSFHVSIK